MSTAKLFEDLDAYQRCREFRMHAIKVVANQLITKKEFSLSDQLKRSARSITANIAEGFGRYHYRDNYKFCSIARGSLNETLEHVICAEDEALIDRSILDKSRELFHPASNLLNGYMAYLIRAANQPNNK